MMTRHLQSVNPATLEVVGEVAITPVHHVDDIVGQAREAFPAWRKTPLSTRARIIKKAQQQLLARGKEFSELITREMGRPVPESLVLEIASCVDIMDYYAKKARQFLDDRRVPLHHLLFRRRESRLFFEPLGVLGIISPWNWPLLIPLGGIVPALLSGNAVVFKHSELTPLLAEKMRELFLEAGVPESIFQIIQGGAQQGKALVDSQIDKVFFTGSTDVGQKIYQQVSHSLKKCVLEMGGSDPAVVCADADPGYVSSGLVWGGFSNCGQNCNSVERIFVHRKISSELIDRLVQKTEKLRIGNGMESDVDMGPLASKAQLKKIQHVVDESVRKGDCLLTGGNRVEGRDGFFYQPTVLLRDRSRYSAADEEVFGPVIFVTEVDDDDEAVRLANRTAFGLCASVWTKNRKHGLTLARKIESGTVMINDAIVSFGMAEAGWTGIKSSGIGWVHGEKGLDEMVNIKYINRDPQNRMQNLWWFPYSDGLLRSMKAGLDFLYSQCLWNKLKSLPIILKNLTGQLLMNRKRSDKL